MSEHRYCIVAGDPANRHTYTLYTDDPAAMALAMALRSLRDARLWPLKFVHASDGQVIWEDCDEERMSRVAADLVGWLDRSAVHLIRHLRHDSGVYGEMECAALYSLWSAGVVKWPTPTKMHSRVDLTPFGRAVLESLPREDEK